MNKENGKERTKKTKVLKIVLIISCVLIISAIVTFVLFYLFFQKTKSQIVETNSKCIKNNEETIEYGTHLSYEQLLEKVVSKTDLFKNTKLKISINDALIDENQEYVFDTVSNNIIVKIETLCPVVSFLNQEATTSEEIVWKVQDTKKPVLSGISDKEITVGDAFDAKAEISAKDEVDGDLEVIIEGEIDINKPGEYTLIAKAIDKNQNEITQSFKVIVKEVSKASTTTPSGSSNNSKKSKTSNTKNSNSSSNADSSSTKEGRLNLAKKEARQVVSKIISNGMTKLQKAKAICNYITTTVSVQTNQSNEAYKTNYGNEAYAALVLKIAACSGRCKAVTLLCDAAGLKSQHINAGQWAHQWNKVQIDDGSWVVVDSQIGFVGNEHPLEW